MSKSSVSRESYSKTLSFYMEQIDFSLNDVDTYINMVAGPSSFDLLSLELADKEDDYYMEVSRGEFTYLEKERVQNYVINAIQKQEIMKNHIKKRWQHILIDKTQYLTDIVHSGNSYIGTLVKVDDILQPLSSLKLAEGGTTLLASDSGGADNRSIVCTATWNRVSK